MAMYDDSGTQLEEKTDIISDFLRPNTGIINEIEKLIKIRDVDYVIKVNKDVDRASIHVKSALESAIIKKIIKSYSPNIYYSGNELVFF